MEQSMETEQITSRLSITPELLQPMESTLGESFHHGVAIISALISAIIQDMQHMQEQTPTQFDTESLGWRNKYTIHLLSGVPQREIYKENGVLAKLVAVELVQKRPSQSRWGNQSHHFRFNLMMAWTRPT